MPLRFEGNQENLSIRTAGIINIWYKRTNALNVCVVAVAASAKPVFTSTLDGREQIEFWVRVGNATKQLYGEEVMGYQTHRCN